MNPLLPADATSSVMEIFCCLSALLVAATTYVLSLRF